MSLRIVASITCALMLIPAPPARASIVLIPPVDAPVIVRYEQPEHRWAPGHRGIDYAAPPGTRVRASADGVVAFSGTVGDTRAVTIRHAFGFATTYSHLDVVEVRRGDEVRQGSWIGTTASAHPGGVDGIHFGVKLNGAYIDPATLLRDADVTAAIHLAPLAWRPSENMPEPFRSAFSHPGTATAPCRDVRPLQGVPSLPPNDNIAVAVAGLSSSTAGRIRADMYQHGPEELGYAPGRVYRFSYAGMEGPRLHRPYSPRDTYGDISVAAKRLERLLARIGRRHPGTDVDLVAHSMGGLVARRFLSRLAKNSRARLPRIDHLVTFSSPHRGAALAELPQKLDSKTLSGRWLLDGMSAWSRSGAPVPDPRSVAVSQLAPGSPLLREMAREGVIYGTKALTLAIPNDVIVTADRATWDEAVGRVVPPAGVQGHSTIVSSDAAQGLAYSFLRDAAASCHDGWDLWGPRVGRLLGFAEGQLHRGLTAVEELIGGRFVRAGKLGYKLAKGRAGRAAGKAIGKLVHRAGVRVLNPGERNEPPPPGGMGG